MDSVAALERKPDLARNVVTVLLLSACWLLWSGHTEPLILVFGAVSVVLCAWIAHRMDQVDRTREPYRLGLRWIPYLPWLLLEIVKANLHVTWVILSPSLPVQPQLIRVKATQDSDLAQTIYANSITLTPGTLTLDVRAGELLVHALTDFVARDLESGGMDRKVTSLEGRG